MNLEDLKRLRRAKDVMDRHYAEPLDIPALAKVALMSSGHFSRSFRAAYGETPYNYLMTRRVERAKALLRRGDMSVTEVCFAVGCTSLGSFSSRFTELVGEAPSAYRARDHGASAAVPACVAKVHTRPARNGEPSGGQALEGPGEPARGRGAAEARDRAGRANGAPRAAGNPVRIGEADSGGAS
ncbi:helix-turn-helix transcriptional regulator [Streptomyces spectabilis]|uniref:Helix-turn-helix transcriptional regulator n=1 Tax=Streptomyces spectabilis TaxID=68270 RepID=A0A516R0W9_STRST|nr:helix-turn-helix transcriptional regulator [Streptomyces spectabilis]QDQ09307.1 helix-turn-helix transcriptional regulator [Streptomyces spectabilis]